MSNKNVFRRKVEVIPKLVWERIPPLTSGDAETPVNELAVYRNVKLNTLSWWQSGICGRNRLREFLLGIFHRRRV